MKDKKLLLVYPEIECSTTNTNTYSLPLGLGSIATFCKQAMGDSLEIRILDGSLVGHKEQLRETELFKPDVIGLAPTIGSQRNAYEIAQLADGLGSIVVFGGVNSTNLWRNMLANREFIDFVVRFEGEKPMLRLLRDFSAGPNIAYKDNNGAVIAPETIEVMKTEELPDIDYSLFDLDRYFKQTESRGFGRAVTYYAGKGCSKRGAMELSSEYPTEDYEALVKAMNVCTFCGRNELGIRNFSEEREAKIIRELHDKYGVTGFFNVQDTVNLGDRTPIRLEDSWFRLFIGTEGITPDNIRKLKQRYGPNLIFQAGVESADPKMRQAYGKTPTDKEDLLRKADLMAKKGIQLHASFILGGRGETPETMQRTAELARTLGDYSNVTWILISPQLVLPGSRDYRMLLEAPGMSKKYAMQDLIDIVEINQDFLSQFSHQLTRRDILKEIRDTFAYIRKRNPKPVLDVKGVVPEEEDYVKPSRPYALK